MSEITKAVIQMPYELAMDGEVSRRQFYMRAQSMLAEKDALQSLNAELLEALEASTLLLRTKRHACENNEVCRVLDVHISRNSAAIAKARSAQ